MAPGHPRLPHSCAVQGPKRSSRLLGSRASARFELQTPSRHSRHKFSKPLSPLRTIDPASFSNSLTNSAPASRTTDPSPLHPRGYRFARRPPRRPPISAARMTPTRQQSGQPIAEDAGPLSLRRTGVRITAPSRSALRATGYRLQPECDRVCVAPRPMGAIDLNQGFNGNTGTLRDL